MARFVPDIKTQRWIIVVPSRTQRPEEVSGGKALAVCPFCPGNEKETPPEISRVECKDSASWQIRVFSNKFPITDIHEVIVHSPDHRKNIEDLLPTQVKALLRVYRQRYQSHQYDGQVIIFCNHGEHAGASLAHPHSQLVVIPPYIKLDALSKEPIQNIVKEQQHFVSYCPEFSQWPYEVWITPKIENTVFAESTDEELGGLVMCLQDTLKSLREIFIKKKGKDSIGERDFCYNYYIYHKENWFLRIIPRFVHRAGFELGTGLSVNIIEPAEAAREIREIKT